jgi:hypothetical protein
METYRMKLKCTFLTPVLGTLAQKDVTKEFIAKKYEEGGGVLPPDELETLDEAVQVGTTAFHKLNDLPIMYDYQFKGFLKEAGRIFNGLQGVKALRSKIDNLVFVEPRQISLTMPFGGEITFNERPLRAETAQGPRIALARSEMLPEGTEFECTLRVYTTDGKGGPVTEDILRELIAYGSDKGLLQWRNGGWGRFMFEVI